MSNRHASQKIRANVRKPRHEPFCREWRCAIVFVIFLLCKLEQGVQENAFDVPSRSRVCEADGLAALV